MRRLDVLVLTHDSLDHVGGAVDVLARMAVGVLLHSRPTRTTASRRPARAVAAARERGVPVREIRAPAR